MTTRRPFSFLSAALCGLALGASVLLAGCGGGGGNGNSGGSANTGANNNGGGGGGTPLVAGSYQGTYVNTSGKSSPDAGTIAFTVSSSGAINGASVDYTGDGSTNNFTGTANSNGSVTTNSGAVVTSPFVQNSTTHVYSTSVTQADGTKGVLSVGLAPTASPLVGSYSGTASNTAQTQSFPLILTISPTGAVAATLGTPVAGNPDSGFTLVGYVDTNGNLYLADTSGGVPENLFATLTLSGTSLTGPTHIAAADGYSNTGTISLTKQ